MLPFPICSGEIARLSFCRLLAHTCETNHLVPALIVLLASNWRSSLPVSCFHPGHVLAPSIKNMCYIAHFCQAIRQVPSHCALFPMSPKLLVSTSPSQTLKVWSSNREAEEDAGPQVSLTNPPKSNLARKVDPIWSIISLDPETSSGHSNKRQNMPRFAKRSYVFLVETPMSR